MRSVFFESPLNFKAGTVCDQSQKSIQYLQEGFKLFFISTTEQTHQLNLLTCNIVNWFYIWVICQIARCNYRTNKGCVMSPNTIIRAFRLPGLFLNMYNKKRRESNASYSLSSMSRPYNYMALTQRRESNLRYSLSSFYCTYSKKARVNGKHEWL